MDRSLLHSAKNTNKVAETKRDQKILLTIIWSFLNTTAGGVKVWA